METEKHDEEASHALLPEKGLYAKLKRAEHQLSNNKLLYVAVICNVVLFTLSILLVLVSFSSLQGRVCKCDALGGSTYFSTVLEDLEAHWGPRQFKTFDLWANESILRQPPSKEVDKAWDRITDIGVMHVSRDEIIKLGKDPGITVQAPESWGYGPDRHLVHLDGVHLLHCLNMMRKSLHFNFPYYYSEEVNQVYHPHLSHCLEALAKRLLCQPSIELIGYNWVDKQEHPFPDFDIYHQCWDFEQLLAWQDRHRVKNIEDKWPIFHRQEGETLLPVPLLILEAYNVTKGNASSNSG